ncbi:MAG: MFS transporter [Rhodospirillales bacterium]|nr:MFS transporter [Rhodospirillales bacterium]
MSPLLNPRLLIIGFGVLILPLDSSVNVAFPDLTHDFGVPVSQARLVVVGFILTAASLMLISGRAGDVWGHRRLFQVGLALSALALSADALAPNFAYLVAARVGQGAAGALIFGCAPALTLGLFPESRRGAAIGIYGLILALGIAIGPLIGGVLTGQWGWQAVFWYRVPIALVALALSVFIPDTKHSVAGTKFDLSGAVVLSLALAALFAALNIAWSGHISWAPLSVAAVLGLVLFVRLQSTSPAPIIDLSYFRRPRFCLLTTTSVLINLASFVVMLLTPFYLRRVTGLDAAASGLVLAAYPIGVAAGAIIAGRVLNRLRAGQLASRNLLMLTPLLCAGGLGMAAQYGPATPIAVLIVTLSATGLALGLFYAAYFYFVTGAMPPENRGVSGALVELTRSAGYLFAASLLFEVFGIIAAAAGKNGAAEEAAFLEGYRWTFMVAAAISFAAFLLSLAAAKSGGGASEAGSG